jgi:hypothetical protein
MEHEQRAEELEREADDLEQQGEQVEQDIREAREDWESKLSASGLPGAADEDAAAPGGTGESEADRGDDDAEGENPETEPGGPA